MRQGDAIVDRYVLEAESSRGGMGVVWKAWDLDGDHPVAVKVLNQLEPDDIGRFRREAAILAELQLPGVVRYIDHGTTGDGEPYLVMEWLDGQTLGQRLDRSGLTMTEAVALVTLVCEILAPLHARGVVHRDLKPENLIIPNDDLASVRLIDFGLARRTREATRITQTGVTVGTPGYMAPEQVRGDRAVSSSVDVFALGCILYECVCGFPAFAGENQIAVQSKILFAEPPRLRLLEPLVPADLELAVARMLAKRASDRPADAAAALTELRGLWPIPAGPSKRARSESPATVVMRPAAEIERTPDQLGLVMALDRVASAGTGVPMMAADVGRREAELGGVLGLHGGRLELLDDGSVVVALAPAPAAALAVRAAQCALALRAALPEAMLSVVTGPMSIEVLIDRAAIALAERERVAIFAPGGAPDPGIAVDDRTAQLLPADFGVRRDGHGWWLVPASRP